jgi:hypothetical protein
MRRAMVVAFFVCVLAAAALAKAVVDDQGTDHRARAAEKVAPTATSGKHRAVRHPSRGIVLAPLAVNDTYASAAGGMGVPAPGVLANDTLNGAAIASYGINGTEQTTVGTVTPTAHGSVMIAADGGLAYGPAPGFSGVDTFKYTLTNTGGSSTAQVEITVAPEPPGAVNDAYTTAQNTPINEPAPGVLANDSVSGSAISGYGATTGSEQTTLGTTTPTAHGTVRVSADGSFTYTPASGFNGTDSFRYTLVNAGGTSVATVTITVQAVAGPDFVVTSPGFFFQFSGVSGQDPVLNLTRGRTYRFQVNTSSIHPFEILDAPIASVSNNNISNGILTFAVPAGAGTYRYHCSIHGFGNTIETAP